jgi:hypothetical protein
MHNADYPQLGDLAGPWSCGGVFDFGPSETVPKLHRKAILATSGLLLAKRLVLH